MLCDVRKRAAAAGAELEVDVDLYTPEGLRFTATPDSTNLPGARIRASRIANCKTGISVNVRPA